MILFNVSALSVNWRVGMGLVVVFFYLVTCLVIDNIYKLSAATNAMFIGIYFVLQTLPVLANEQYQRENFVKRESLEKQQAKLETEQGKAESLLGQLLPPKIVAQLKSGRTDVADDFQSVTVLFTDMKGFTAYSSQLTPDELVEFLNNMCVDVAAFVWRLSCRAACSLGCHAPHARTLPPSSHLSLCSHFSLSRALALSLSRSRSLALICLFLLYLFHVSLRYSAFDEVLMEHGLTKVEVIGDAYYVVGGCPDVLPAQEHAVNTVDAALAMLRMLPRVIVDPTVQMRVGVHSGPVVAAIVGKRDPRYHLFGATVSYAEKMESHGIPGRVHCRCVRLPLSSLCCHPPP